MIVSDVCRHDSILGQMLLDTVVLADLNVINTALTACSLLFEEMSKNSTLEKFSCCFQNVRVTFKRVRWIYLSVTDNDLF